MSIERIQCHVHGDQQRTYVCQHIAAEYEGEEDAVKKHRPRKDRREAVEERKPKGTTYVPIEEWLRRHKS
jgi:hypothetical protein